MRVHPIIKILIIIVLIAALGTTYYFYKQRTNEATALNKELAAEAQQYEEEIDEIEEQIADKKASLTASREVGDFVISFVCKTTDDVSKAASFAAQYGFTPAIVIDCNNIDKTVVKAAGDYDENGYYIETDVTAFDNLIEAVKNTGYEIMLTSSPLSIDNVTSVRQEITDAGYTNISGIFYLKTDDATAENIKAICNLFMGYTQYTDEVGDGITDDGMVYFDYTAVTNQAVTADDVRYASALEGRDVIMYCFDLTSADLNDAMVTASLTVIKTTVTSGTMRFATLTDSITDVRSLGETKATENAEYEAFYEEKQAEIEELNTKIKSVYNS